MAFDFLYLLLLRLDFRVDCGIGGAEALVNRGFLRGPMLPIYGFGATIMLHVSLPLAGHPVQIYFAGLVVATAFEYVVGVLMERIFKVKILGLF